MAEQKNTTPVKEPSKQVKKKGILIEVPESIKKRFKAFCAMAGVDMTQRLLEHIESDLEGSEKGAKAKP